GLRVLETGGRHLAGPMGVRLDEPQRFGAVRGILATAHAHLPVATTGAKSYLRVSPSLASRSFSRRVPRASRRDHLRARGDADLKEHDGPQGPDAAGVRQDAVPT